VFIPFKYIYFFKSEEIDVKDVESEIFSEKREVVNFFFFHNKDMHFDKSVIREKTLNSLFENIHPHFENIDNTLIMTKKIQNFNNDEFDSNVEKFYSDYLNRINYRIDCIFQTFGLFANLYKDKNLVFVFPFQIYDGFIKYINEYNILVEELGSLSETDPDIDILNRTNYYASQNIKFQNHKNLIEENIVKIFKLL